MPRRRIAALSALTLALVLGGGITAAGLSAGPVGAALLRQAASTGTLQLGGALIHNAGQAESENWSGYVVTPSGGHVTGVSGTFVVPDAGFDLPGIASTWAGIGGDGTPDLIQAGVAESSFPSLPLLGDQYYAWYELLPSDPVQLTNCSGESSCAVAPGDQMSVKITQNGPTSWTITETDADKWSWTDSSITYASQNASAEWILEAPTFLVSPLDLAGVGTVHFGPYSSYSVNNGAPQTIADGDPTVFTMTLGLLGLITEASPSALGHDGQSFNVCAYRSSCAAPA
jgi:peptidase A4-like protein